MKVWIRALAGAAALGLLSINAGHAQSQGPLGTEIPGTPLGKAVDEAAGPEAFLENQLSFARVAHARDSTEARLKSLFEKRGLGYPAREIFIRVFKHERQLELWGRNDPDSTFTLIKQYPVCALPGQLGPKRRVGDVQVPEGVYFIDDFNPNSAYHLSLRVSYPNLADRIRRQHLSLGGDIYIHGGCETVGCVPIENSNIEEVYWLAVQATDAGQRVIPVHIFPARLDPERLRWLERLYHPERALRTFWENLSEAYRYFEVTHRVPWITVAQDGRYTIPPLPGLAADSTGGAVVRAARETAAPAAATPKPLPTDTVAAETPSARPAAADTVPPDSIGPPRRESARAHRGSDDREGGER